MFFSMVRMKRVQNIIEEERERQERTLTFIASENHASQDVLKSQGSLFTNKYAEGYPDARYYAGCENADEIEKLAIERAKKLWGADHVNVQPHSGTQANQAVYLAELSPGDTILSLKLSHGGHLSHGSNVNFSGQIYDSEHYGVDLDDGRLDYEDIKSKAEEYNPDMIVSGFSAYPREVEFSRIQEIADDHLMIHVADIAHITGLVASGHHENPVGTADYVTGSTHKTIRSGRGGIIMTQDQNADDLDSAVFPGSQGGPAMHSIAGKAVGFGEALTEEFKKYSDQVIRNATALSRRLSKNGFHAVTGGTDNHIVLLDLRESHPDLTGKMAENALSEIGIIANKNTVPGETRSPFVTSGLRLGTPATTTRGMTEEDMREIADIISSVLNNPKSESVVTSAEEKVSYLCSEYPVYDF